MGLSQSYKQGEITKRKIKYRSSKNRKVLACGFIKSVKHPTWLANIVPVKKKNGQVRICIDYRDLNKACPKDEFPLANMDMLIDSTSGQGMLSFMDGFNGYNKIKMANIDVEKTTFRTPRGIDVDPDKARAIASTAPPSNQKQLKSFLGRLSYIRHFIPGLAAAPIPGIPLKLYLAATDTAVGALLAQDDENGEEHLVYYWPFHTWGLDFVGKINPASEGCVWIITAIEFSTKWVEAIPLHKASGAAVCNFIREYIICRHGVPYKIVTDNGTPFVNREVNDMLKGYGVNLVLPSRKRSTRSYK
ncbi:hypothetical protein ACLB2K_052799 [Fragaria x ananassa]